MVSLRTISGCEPIAVAVDLLVDAADFEADFEADRDVDGDFEDELDPDEDDARVSEPACVLVCFGFLRARTATMSTATPTTAMRTPARRSRR